MSGDGSITVRVTSLVNAAKPAPGGNRAVETADASIQPWAKAGIMVKESATAGSQYASVVATASHGVQMQYNFTHSEAGSPGTVSATSPQWLRLSRSGDTLTGYESASGTSWTEIGTVSLSGLPSTVQAGLFVASPMAQVVKGTENVRFIPTQAAATFDNLGLQGQWPGSAWTGTDIGQAEQLELDGGSPALPHDGYTRSGAFGVQQTLPRYSQAPAACLPYNGCFPLSPWTGLLVLCAWTAVALGVAMLALRGRDA